MVFEYSKQFDASLASTLVICSLILDEVATIRSQATTTAGATTTAAATTPAAPPAALLAKESFVEVSGRRLADSERQKLRPID